MNNNNFKDVLRVYFSRLFPYTGFYRWLNYGDENLFSHREFALNFEGERFLRYQSYPNIDDLKKVIKKLCPLKIDIGAVYNKKPASHSKKNAFYPVQKELVFDLDMTDYDEVRTCCSECKICVKCWGFMTIAVKIIDATLREDFGFKNILWSFSGRRGVHCWVCDQRARLLRKDARFAVANYLQVVTGGEYKKKKVEINDKIHHSVKRALEIIEPLFVEMCIEEQNILGTEEGINKFLGIIAEDEMRTEVKALFDEYPTSLTRWEAFLKFFKNKLESECEEWCRTPFLIQEIMIQYTYPRLDINVTLGMTHLLKMPFCVHPKTGKIGVPVDPSDIDNFSPWSIPTIMDLMDEIDEFDKKAKKQGMSTDELKNIEDLKKTSLNKCVRLFENFLEGLEISAKEALNACVNLEI